MDSSLKQVVAATVYGQPVTAEEVLRELHWRTGADFLAPAIVAKLLYREAHARGITVTDEELQRRADAFREEQGLYRAEDTYSWLEARHLTVDGFEALIEREVLQDKIAHVLAAPRMEEYFESHRSEFDRVELSTIVLDNDGVARELFAQIVEDGRDFHEVAQTHSRDAESARQGGRLGTVDVSELDDQVATAIRAAGPGQVIGPLLTDAGYQIIRVEQYRPATLDDDIRAAIEQRLFQAWLEENWQSGEIRLDLLEAARGTDPSDTTEAP